MTEEDAKTKWCPHGRQLVHAGPNSIAVNRNSNVNTEESSGFTCCIASGCMMWAWDEAFDRDGAGNMIGGTNYDTEGHCGLAK